MKKKITIILFFAASTFMLTAQTDATNLGLVDFLMQVKYQNELKLAQGIRTNDSVKVALAYYKTYVALNSFVSQLEADINSSNSLKIYNKLDKLLKNSNINNCLSTDKIVQNYIDKLKLLSGTNKSVTAAIAMASTLLDLTSKSVGVYKEIQDIKAAKVSKICAILDAARLSSPFQKEEKTDKN